MVKYNIVFDNKTDGLNFLMTDDIGKTVLTVKYFLYNCQDPIQGVYTFKDSLVIKNSKEQLKINFSLYSAKNSFYCRLLSDLTLKLCFKSLDFKLKILRDIFNFSQGDLNDLINYDYKDNLNKFNLDFLEYIQDSLRQGAFNSQVNIINLLFY